MWRVSGVKQFYFARDLLTFPKAKTNGLKILNYHGNIEKKGIKS